MRIQDHFSISVNLDIGHGSAQVCVPLGHSSLYFYFQPDESIHRDLSLPVCRKRKEPFVSLRCL